MKTKIMREAIWEPKFCDVCNRQTATSLLGRREYQLTTRNCVFHMKHIDVVCNECGFVFAEQIPDEAFLLEYYQDEFSWEGRDEGRSVDFEPQARIAALQKYLSPGSSILEVGANAGDFCEALKKSGFDAVGFDPLSKKKEGIHSGFVSSKDDHASEIFEEKKYDAIVSYFVLEHIAKPRAWLESLKRMLKPGGFIFIEVPNFKDYPAWSLVGSHLLHFSPPQLKRFIESSGLEISEVGITTASRFYGFLAVARLPHNDLATAIANAKNSYRVGTNFSGALLEKHRMLAKKIARMALAETDCRVYVWCASQVASDLLPALYEAGLDEIVLVDNSRDKEGEQHPGSRTLIKRPHFDPLDESRKIIILCSPPWHKEIKAQIKSMEIKNCIVIDPVEEYGYEF